MIRREGVKTMNNKNYVVNSSKDMFYDANEGFIKGNMQKSIYDQYKNYTPVEPKVKNEKEALLLFIQKCGLAAHDMVLYLDTHPNAKDALDLHEYYTKQYKDALDRYQEKYGPLSVSDTHLTKVPFEWVSSPWPWEG